MIGQWTRESDSRKSSSSESSECSMSGTVKKHLKMRLTMSSLNRYDGGSATYVSESENGIGNGSSKWSMSRTMRR